MEAPTSKKRNRSPHRSKRKPPSSSSEGEREAFEGGSKKRQTNLSEAEESDSEDEYLHAAVAAWAMKAEEKPANFLSSNLLANKTDPLLSVHITQIAFLATQLDLHRHFADQGCAVTSVRLVYDKGIDKQRQFRGVAFVDLADEESFQKALELNKSILLGRKINVRPTRSTTELSDIVQATRERVASKIRTSKNQQKEEKRTPPGKRYHLVNPPKKREAEDNNAKGDRKLTKKERNRRAAILRQKRKF